MASVTQEHEAVGEECDVVVVGARPAGAATATLLARSGLRVIVLDRSQPGTDTLSTHALTRTAMLVLERLGLTAELIDKGTPPIRNTTFHFGAETVSLDMAARDGIDALYAPRRTILDPIISASASSAGADVRYGSTVKSLVKDETGRVRGVSFVDAEADRERTISASLVVGADGVRSIVARQVEADTYWSRPEATAMIYSYFSNPGILGYHWAYNVNATAGLIPTNGEQLCVWVGTPSARFMESLRGDPKAAFDLLLNEAAPEFTETFSSAKSTERFLGYAGQPSYMRQSCGPGWALVGDAGYFKDPLTAHGITDALSDAESLAAAIVESLASNTDEPLRAYQDRRDELGVDFASITSDIASYNWDINRIKELVRDEGRLLAKEAHARREPIRPGQPRHLGS